MSSPESSAVIRFPSSALKEKGVREYLEGMYELEINQAGKIDEMGPGDIELEIENGVFRLYDSIARGGTFEELEEILTAKAIPFDRKSAMDWQSAPCLVVFRPVTGDMEKDLLWFALDPETDEPVMRVSRLREFLVSDACKTVGSVKHFLDAEFPAYTSLEEWVQEDERRCKKKSCQQAVKTA